jgi:hypothetical protein
MAEGWFEIRRGKKVPCRQAAVDRADEREREQEKQISFPIESYCPNTKERYNVCWCDDCDERAEDAMIAKWRKELYADKERKSW